MADDRNAEWWADKRARYPFTVQVDGIIEAWADDLAEAVMVAFHLTDQARGFVAIADEAAQMLVLGWWLPAVTR